MKRYAFDLDGTLCETEGENYAEAVPIQDRIDRVNQLHAEGHYIIVHTARGAMKPPEERARILRLTASQLIAWGLEHHELLPKPFAHVYVDDRAVFSDHFFTSSRGT